MRQSRHGLPDGGQSLSLQGALGIENRVCFLGALAEVKPVLAAADCKVLASKAETFSMAMLESMSMAVPVISTKVGGAAEAITDRESGMLVTPGDVDVLAGALEWLLEDDARLRMVGEAARQSVLQSFRYRTMIMRSAEFLLDAVGQPAKGIASV